MQRFPNAREKIAATCLTYFYFDVFAKKYNLEYHQRKGFESRWYQKPFLKYAAHHGVNHAFGDVEKKVADRVITLLINERKVLNCCQVLLLTSENPYFTYYHNFSKANKISRIHLTALFGLRDTMSLLLNKELGAD